MLTLYGDAMPDPPITLKKKGKIYEAILILPGAVETFHHADEAEAYNLAARRFYSR